jgi:hypothetical protein
VIIDGNDSDPRGAITSQGDWYVVQYSYFTHTTQIVTGGTHSFHDNVEDYFSDNGHANILEQTRAWPTSSVFYNNVGSNWGPAIGLPGMVGFWLIPPVGTTDYVFNNIQNVLANIQQNNIGDNNNAVGTYYYFNNTLETDAANTIFNNNTAQAYSLLDTNNHLIGGTRYADGDSGASKRTSGTSLVQTKSVANRHGYTSAETYIFSPAPGCTPATCGTLGTGTNLQNVCNTLLASSDPFLQAAGAACQSDTTYGCAYNTSTHTLTCPARTPVARPVSTAWDVGAY